MLDSYWSNLTSKPIGRRRALAAGTATTAAALLAACGSGKSSSGGAGGDKTSLVTQPVETTKQAKRGGIMKDRQYADPPSLDILTANNPWYSTGYAVYNSLVQYEPGYLKPSQNEMAPDLAESWEYSPDGLQITLKLRQGVKFHNKPPVNGRAMDMDDVLFNWQRFSSKYSGRNGVVNAVNPDAPVVSFSATDSRTIVMKLKEPLVYALGLFVGTNGTGLWIVPKEADSSLDLRGDMLGTGPWYLANYTPSVGFTLKRNPEFWDKDWNLVDQIDLPIISDYAAALAQFKTGSIYYMGSHTSAGIITQEDVLPLKREVPAMAVYQSDLAYPGVNVFNFGWLPEGKSPFLDERVRQAVSMSWDRDLFLDAILNVSRFRSEGVPVETRWSSHLDATYEGWWLDPKGKDFGPNAKYFQRDVAEAKKLLSAAGYPNGFETVSHYVTGPELNPLPKTAPVLDGFIRDIGITAKVDSVDYLKDYVPNIRDGRGQYAGYSYSSSAGAPTGGSAVGVLAGTFWSKSGASFRGFSTGSKNDQAGDPQVDALIEKARGELDTEKRRALVYDLQRYLAKAMYLLIQPGAATGLTAAWPCIENLRVFRGGRPHNRLWINDAKPPLKSA